MKALIFGISGPAGAYPAKLMLNRGFQVWGTSGDVEASVFERLPTLGVRNKINLVAVIPSDFQRLFSSIKAIRPDNIYNLSDQSSVGLSFEQSAETLERLILGTFNVLEAIKIIYSLIRYYGSGSVEVFRNQALNPYTE